MCVQVSDWNLYELTVHLTETHLVEEAVIVAAHRTLPVDDILLVNINGMTSSQTYAFIKDAYNKFDWKARRVPNDLQNRGFPESELASKNFHNYAYGRNMSALWQKYQDLPNFRNEMRNPLGGAVGKFTDLNTVEEVIDMVVMCIHIACPQNTAANYLQDYYQAFVPNKPSCLCTPLPQTIERLNTFTEEDLVQAFPVKHPRVWLMASHLPYLLGYQVDQKQTLLNYAVSLQKLAENTAGDPIYDAPEFGRDKTEMDDQLVPYNVMDPDATTVSILL
ncbi:valencene oxygenase [Hyaloscypha finlandica]|nr:valencene oxygenase [Hyaloscypha finlandica]KAH8797548.1 valencene oxygenase [Hyaloscypha sp. PMI_1271]